MQIFAASYAYVICIERNTATQTTWIDTDMRASMPQCRAHMFINIFGALKSQVCVYANKMIIITLCQNCVRHSKYTQQKLRGGGGGKRCLDEEKKGGVKNFGMKKCVM